MPDFDRDGVPNKWDCQPKNRFKQDFTPFPPYKSQKAAEMTAARRFGGLNLARLKKLGSGRDRTVYALDKDKVIKVAKNPGGLTQNTSESDLEYLGQLKHYETGKDYAVMQRADPPGEATRKFLKPLKKAASRSNVFVPMGMRVNPAHTTMEFLSSPEVEKADKEVGGLFNDLTSFGDIIPQELIAKRQWGEVDGKPVLIDGGALQNEQSISRYRVKDFQKAASIDRERAPPWQLEEWQDVQNQRSRFRKKGKPDDDRELMWAKKGRLPPEYGMKEARDMFDVVDSREEVKQLRAPGWSRGLKSDLPAFEGGWADKSKEETFEKRRVLMPADEFLRRQYEQSGYADDFSFEQWKQDASKTTKDRLVKDLGDQKQEVPIPIEEFNVKGEMRDLQEGRKRGLAAEERGEMVPVLQVRKKLPPWDRENKEDPYTPKKDAFYLNQEKIEDNQWDREKGMFDYDTLEMPEEVIEETSEIVEDTIEPETVIPIEQPEPAVEEVVEEYEDEDEKLRQEE